MTKAILDKSKTPFYRLDASGRVEYVNQAACESIGYSEQELVGLGVWTFDPDFKPEYWPGIWEKLKKNEIIHINTRHRRKDGSFIDVEVTGHYINIGATEFSFCFVQDVTERKANEAMIRQKESYLRALIDNFPFIVWLKDKDSRFLTVNQAYAHFYGYQSPEQIAGKTDVDLSPLDLATRYREHDLDIMCTGKKQIIEEEQQGPNGRHWIETYKAPVIGQDGEILGTVGFSRDITERKMLEDKMKLLGHYDSLTGLPNRVLLMDRLQIGIAHAKRHKTPYCLMYVDLDKFKQVNDSLGHDQGDLLLKEVAQRLLKYVKRGIDTVARIGGDEFIVLLANQQREDLMRIADAILSAMQETFYLEGNAANISASIGIALYPDDGEDVKSLIKAGDTALYEAKKSGKNCYKFLNDFK